MIEELKQQFYDAVDAARDSFCDLVYADKADAEERRRDDNDAIEADFEAAQMRLTAAVEANVQAVIDANAEAVATFEADTQEELDAYLAEVDAAKMQVDQWVDKKIEWAQKEYHYDSYHLEHVIEKLENWREQAQAQLDARKESAREIAAEINEQLADCLEAIDEDVTEHGEDTIADFEEFGEDVVDQLADDGQDNYDDFAKAADREHGDLEDFLLELAHKWEYWLKQEPENHGYIVLLD